jgi:hypothetical protein
MPRKGSRKLASKNERMPEVRSFFRVYETRIMQDVRRLLQKGPGRNGENTLFLGEKGCILKVGFLEGKAGKPSGRLQAIPKRGVFWSIL